MYKKKQYMMKFDPPQVEEGGGGAERGGPRARNLVSEVRLRVKRRQDPTAN